jgi:hypothetical protein
MSNLKWSTKKKYDHEETRVRVFDLLAAAYAAKAPGPTVPEMVEALSVPPMVVRRALSDLKLAADKHQTGYTLTYHRNGRRCEWALTNVRADCLPAWNTQMKTFRTQLVNMLKQSELLSAELDGRTMEARLSKRFELNLKRQIEDLDLVLEGAA